VFIQCLCFRTFENIEDSHKNNNRYLTIGTGDLFMIGVAEKEKSLISIEIEQFNKLKNPFYL